MTAISRPLPPGGAFEADRYAEAHGWSMTGWDKGLSLSVPAGSTVGTVTAGWCVLRGFLYRIVDGTTETVSVPLSAGTYWMSVLCDLNSTSTYTRLVCDAATPTTNHLPLWKIVRNGVGEVTLTDLRRPRVSILYGSPTDLPPSAFPAAFPGPIIKDPDGTEWRSDGTKWVRMGDTGWRTDGVTIGTGFEAISTNLTKWRVRQGEATVEVRVRRSGGDFALSQNGDVGGDITLVQMPAALQKVQVEGIGSVRNPGTVSGWTVGVRLLPTGEVQLLDGIPGGVILTGGEVTATVKFTADRG